MNDEPEDRTDNHELPHQKATRRGRESGQRDGDWRDNPYAPGSREYYAFGDAQEDAKRDR